MLNLVFDLGNVLFRFDPEAILAYHVPDKALHRSLQTEVFGSVEWVMLDRGSQSIADAIARIKQRLPESQQAYVETLILHWQDAMGPIPGSLELIQELHELGAKLYLLSNISESFHDYKHEIEALGYMDGLYISSDHKLLKPDPKIYLHAAECFGIDPHESVFIDDVAMNVEGAKRAGFHSLVFHGDTRTLRRELIALGFPLTETGAET